MNICKRNAVLFLIFFGLTAAMIFSGCAAGSYMGKKKPVADDSSKRYLLVPESESVQVNQVVLAKEPDAPVAEQPVSSESAGTKTDSAAKDKKPADTKSSDKTKKVVAQGYRIQLLTTTEKSLSDSLYDVWGRDLGLTIYKTFESPYYKLRTGDFETEEDAKDLLHDLQRRGFDNVWIVRDRVMLDEKE